MRGCYAGLGQRWENGTVVRVEMVSDPGDDRVSDYFRLRDVNLRRSFEAEQGLFMAESVEVIGRAIAAGYEPRSFLVLQKWLPEVSAWAEEADVPVFVATPDILTQIVGFRLHRGAMAAMRRRTLPELDAVIGDEGTLVIIEDVVDHTNVGAIFRSVAALGACGVLVTPRCADPLYRRSVRVSMGTVFQVPWTRMPSWEVAHDRLRERGVRIVGLGFGPESVDIRSIPGSRRNALVLGTERTGLSARARTHTDVIATIPMQHGVDSLNVGAAAAVALWELVR